MRRCETNSRILHSGSSQGIRRVTPPLGCCHVQSAIHECMTGASLVPIATTGCLSVSHLGGPSFLRIAEVGMHQVTPQKMLVASLARTQVSSSAVPAATECTLQRCENSGIAPFATRGWMQHTTTNPIEAFNTSIPP